MLIAIKRILGAGQKRTPLWTLRCAAPPFVERAKEEHAQRMRALLLLRGFIVMRYTTSASRDLTGAECSDMTPSEPKDQAGEMLS
jgi:hypothetical protein